MTNTNPASNATADPAGGSATPTANGIATGPPFGSEFFATVLAERVRAECQGRPEVVPVVELQLADGYTVDLCHIPGIGPQWIAAHGYRDRETCEEMDLQFIPYGLVTRVTISLWHRSQRPIGFQLDDGSHGADEMGGD